MRGVRFQSRGHLVLDEPVATRLVDGSELRVRPSPRRSTRPRFAGLHHECTIPHTAHGITPRRDSNACHERSRVGPSVDDVGLDHAVQRRADEAPEDDRAGGPRRYLMCPPHFFEVVYQINHWMHPEHPVDRARAVTQWTRLHDVLEDLGHVVETIEAHPGLPDMVFAANGALVAGRRAVAARMANAERQGEEPLYQAWLAAHGITDIRTTANPCEGEGDFVFVDGSYLGGTGFRTSAAAHHEVAEILETPVTTLHLCDPRWYHLDMALFALDARAVAYYPGAFRQDSRSLLAERFPDALVATEDDALAFGLNSISDGHHVVVPAGAISLGRALGERGYDVIPVDMSELHRAGGSAKCCALQLPPAAADS